MAVSLLFGIQAAELRTKIVCGHYDASQAVSPATLPLYTAIYDVIGREFDGDKALIWNDYEQAMDAYIAAITEDIRAGGKIVQAVTGIRNSLC